MRPWLKTPATLVICFVLSPLALLLAFGGKDGAFGKDGVFDLSTVKPLAQQVTFVLRSQPNTRCEVKLAPGPAFRCEGKTLDSMSCAGVAVTYNPECVEFHVSKEKP